MDRRERLAALFRDTQMNYITDSDLAAAVATSSAVTRLYPADAMPAFPKNAEAEGAVSVTRARSYEAAMGLCAAYPGRKVAVLNFASATSPGGGVVRGSTAQEECLCRCSTLYAALDQERMWKAYYDVNRAARNVLHTDDCIYTPGVVIFKTDEDFPELMPREEWRTVDVISCAAPNLREIPANIYNPESGAAVSITDEELQRLHEQRAKCILAVCAANQADVLVLGAFGCGAFSNDPQVVARAYANVMREYRRHFTCIEFAVYCRPNETVNYDAFRQAMSEFM